MNNKHIGRPPRTTLQIFGRVGGLGISFAIIVCAAAYIGYEADSFFLTKPVLTCAGTIFGFIAALVSIYKIIKKDIL